ncbi:hypothetical protein [Candidatus Marithrix sp. Canyon 246]|uniref:hypothetical protein n=1 Tax=Candidatus Marithrix sp. Canyon 246 TaxID=1827136 RepID=UPI000849F2EE|nr:hypothetical protein [Candidatus Marithrix sp. Canyon 246]
MNIYANIGKNNQLLIATQSPPSSVDVNSILTEIMGADNRPKKLLTLMRIQIGMNCIANQIYANI